MSVLIELNELAKDVCENICKFPEQYDCQDKNEINENFEKMIDEQCENCPINELLI